jgi:hypothetical protein
VQHFRVKAIAKNVSAPGIAADTPCLHSLEAPNNNNNNNLPATDDQEALRYWRNFHE